MKRLSFLFFSIFILLLQFNLNCNANPVNLQDRDNELISVFSNGKNKSRSDKRMPGPSEDCSKHGINIDPSDPFFWLRILAVLFLLLTAAMMSGLTIGLISLDLNNLAILKNSGTPTQQRYASIVEPIRRNGHLLLCTLLILNMLATETLPIVLDDILGGGIYAIIVSTCLIVLFGEIIPQAICARHALAIGAYSAGIVRVLMFITWPIAWPISKLLSWLIGEHEGVVYRRSELKELVSLHGPKHFGELTSDEVTIIASVLELKNKQVEQVMTPLADVFMLDLDTVLDAAAFRLIHAVGYSRIPVFVNGDRTSIIGVILVKSLITVDASKQYRIRDVKDHLLTSIQYFDAKANLFNILNEFQEGKGHLAVIAENLVQEHVGDHSRLKVVGILTLEDVVEEVIGEEIIDETDLFVDMRTKRQVIRKNNYSRTRNLSPPLPSDHFTKRSVKRSKIGFYRRPVTFETHYGGQGDKHQWSGLSTWTNRPNSKDNEFEDVTKIIVERMPNDDDNNQEYNETDELLLK